MKQILKLVFVALSIVLIAGRISNTQSFTEPSLYLTWVGVVDNGEGDNWPGPYGNLYMTLYDADGKEIKEIRLVGPSKGNFLDGDQMFYGDPIYIGPARILTKGVGIKIWESDPGPLLKDDILFKQWINSLGFWPSADAATEDAIENALKRNAYWAWDIWQHHGGIVPGIPKMFVEIRVL